MKTKGEKEDLRAIDREAEIFRNTAKAVYWWAGAWYEHGDINDEDWHFLFGDVEKIRYVLGKAYVDNVSSFEETLPFVKDCIATIREIDAQQGKDDELDKLNPDKFGGGEKDE